MTRERNERMRTKLVALARRLDRAKAVRLLEGITLGVATEQLDAPPTDELSLVERLNLFLSDPPEDTRTIDFGVNHGQALARVGAIGGGYRKVAGYLMWSRNECCHAFEVDLGEALGQLEELWLLTNRNVYLLDEAAERWIALELDYYDTEEEYVRDGAAVLRTNFDRGVV